MNSELKKMIEIFVLKKIGLKNRIEMNSTLKMMKISWGGISRFRIAVWSIWGAELESINFVLQRS